MKHLDDAIKASQGTQGGGNAVDPTYYNNLGLSLFEIGDYAAALDNYSNAITNERDRLAKDPQRGRENLSFYYKNLGLAYYH